MRIPVAVLSLFLSLPLIADPIDDAVQASHRAETSRARDAYRHPAETLRFFELAADQAVVEIWPGGGWYTEVLAPLICTGGGKLVLAGFAPTLASEEDWRKRMAASLDEKLKASPVYDCATVTELSPPERSHIAPDASADRVLTFRNVHNWLKAGTADAVFASMHRALKPGGLLGVVEHRAKPGSSLEEMIASGYVTEDQVKELAAAAGFEFVDASEINANDKDTKGHPAGVWTLPPTLRLKEVDRDKYLVIGESDRMTLKFRKPPAK